jgi:hypothetical protein
MPTVKISALPSATTPLVGTELLELVQGGVSTKVAARDVAASFSTNPANILPLAAGGTGASTAAVARTNLGATTVGSNLFTLPNNTTDITFPRLNVNNTVSALTASDFRTATSSAVSGANGDITSLTGLTTALSVPQGGTGATALTGYVKGNGASAMTASASVPVADITGTLPVGNGGTGATGLSGYVKGNGASAMTAAATIPYNDLAGHAWICASSTSDQAGNYLAAVAFTLDTGTSGTGITVNASTQITFAAAGTYLLSPAIQFSNSSATDYPVTVWFRKNGTNIANSGGIISVPKAADGGVTLFATPWIETGTAGQYSELMWLLPRAAAAAAIKADATGSVPGPPAVPAIASIIVPVTRIA